MSEHTIKLIGEWGVKSKKRPNVKVRRDGKAIVIGLDKYYSYEPVETKRGKATE